MKTYTIYFDKIMWKPRDGMLQETNSMFSSTSMKFTFNPNHLATVEWNISLPLTNMFYCQSHQTVKSFLSATSNLCTSFRWSSWVKTFPSIPTSIPTDTSASVSSRKTGLQLSPCKPSAFLSSLCSLLAKKRLVKHLLLFE